MILTMDSILRKVLALGNKEQNQHYPPHLFQEHYNLVSDWLFQRIVEIYPNDRATETMAKPFLKVKPTPVVNGLIKLEQDYRHLLSFGVQVETDNPDKCCGEGGRVYENDPLAPSTEQLQQEGTKKQCKSVPIRIVKQAEWDRLTTHPYKAPTMKDPIACLFTGEGYRVCPSEITSVDVRYMKEPKQYVYNYTWRPDDTYEFKKEGSVESEWETTAMTPIFRGVSTLYAMYVRDSELRDYNVELKKIGIF